MVSIVGRFLEHARIYIFGRGERAKSLHCLCGLYDAQHVRRVEIASPIYDN